METGAEIKIDQPEVKSVEEKIKDRFEQGDLDRITEYITGFHLDNPELFNKMEDDQARVRARYGLLTRDYKYENRGEYERYLRELAEVNGVDIRSRSDCGNFFEKNTMAGGVSLDYQSILGIDMVKENSESYTRSLNTFEHELIHALQDKYYPSMPIEVKEYEAYVANWNIDRLRSDVEVLKTAFEMGVSSSVGQWYREQSESAGKNIAPVWKNPEYFLKNIDGVSEEAIQKYKTEHQIDTEK